VEKEEVLVIGGSCTRKREHLDHFGVVIEKDFNVRRMIPDTFLRLNILRSILNVIPCFN
jgi:hypothetical protein